MIYLLAVETGLRSSEIASLTRGNFNLDTLPFTVTVAAAYSKRRREDVLLLRPNSELVPMLRSHLATKLPNVKALSIPPKTEVARMLRGDLNGAGIDELDQHGRKADFHALRHTYVTMLAQSGATVKVTQELARHQDPRLTFGVYAHIDDAHKLEALSALPPLMTPASDHAARATGTDASDGQKS